MWAAAYVREPAGGSAAQHEVGGSLEALGHREIHGGVEVADAAEVQGLGAVGHRPGLGAIAGEAGAVEVGEAQAVAVLLVRAARLVHIRAETPVAFGLLGGRAQRALGAAEAVHLVVTPAAAVNRDRPLAARNGRLRGKLARWLGGE